jgi:hypothetical protein
VKVVIVIGTVCAFSSRRRAVTTTSSIPVALDAVG